MLRVFSTRQTCLLENNLLDLIILKPHLQKFVAAEFHTDRGCVHRNEFNAKMEDLVTKGKQQTEKVSPFTHLFRAAVESPSRLYFGLFRTPNGLGHPRLRQEAACMLARRIHLLSVQSGVGLSLQSYSSLIKQDAEHRFNFCLSPEIASLLREGGSNNDGQPVRGREGLHPCGLVSV